MQPSTVVLAFAVFLSTLFTVLSLPTVVESDTAEVSAGIGTGIATRVLRTKIRKRFPEVANIIGHSHTGEITHDISHYFDPAAPEQRLRHHMNTTKALTNPILEQIMISDHPPFVKRQKKSETAVAKAFPGLSERKEDDRNGFVDFTRTVWQEMQRPFEQSLRDALEGQSVAKGVPKPSVGRTHRN